MELWLDTINFDVIKKATQQLSITGVTTNPTILSKANKSCDETIRHLLDAQPGLLAVQVTSSDENVMLEQAHRLRALSDRIIVKVPVFQGGLHVIRQLALENIPTMATAIFETSQIYLSILSGAQYAAPYLGRIEKMNESSNTIQDMLNAIKMHNSSLKIIAASIKSKAQVLNCLLSGVQAITLPELAYFDLITDNSFTMECIDDFRTDWNDSQLCANSTFLNNL